ncbi:type I-C CRISPR-associated protein Cas8c/Csd1 [Nitrospirillum pindoramense]|uniref:CRISPR-associated Csd1 family protein n=1 Tax=Nitrospirillum amazonense TaxID=28077 RepID=A0A560HH95_9PROT|nr:type I-C CRISPR-associated protein Cas8c/Csd1 [Nitrospirillum amazonense]TWB45805.1 CRISPR-associated Csd1 family protein [Nitrospirillum amazonense]
MTILAALNRHYDRLADLGLAPPFGYTTEKIGFCLLLGADGTLVRAVDLRATEGRKLVERPTPVPKPPKRTSGISPAFLWDNSKYVLGLIRDKDGQTILSFPAHQAAFRDRHERALADSNDAGLVALLIFLRNWSPEGFADSGLPPDILNANIVFALDSDYRDQHRFLHDRPAARALWARELAVEAGSPQMCLVTGEMAAPARLHPAIKGVWGAQSSGASLVSFNLDAFTSYGKDQGANAPVSEAAAAGYGAALNALLEKGSRNRIQVGDTSVAFWADASGVGTDAARRAEEAAADLLIPRFEDEEDDDVGPTDAEEAVEVRDRLEDVSHGRPRARLVADVDPDTRFYLLGLAPNAARLSVRFWHETTFGPFMEALSAHWHDLRIDPPAWKGPPKLQALLFPTAVQGKADNIPPLLGGELMRAVLNPNQDYPRTLLSAVLQRIRAGDQNNMPRVFAARAALCKAWLARHRRLAHPDRRQEDFLVSLDRAEKDPAYRLGRLFAVLEGIQFKALGSINAGIRDRYFGAASATPAAVFPLLLRGSNHHLSVLRKRPATRGLANWFEGQIGEIVNELAPDLPRHLGLESQGRFVVGYYHQRSDRAKPATEDATDLAADQEP